MTGHGGPGERLGDRLTKLLGEYPVDEGIEALFVALVFAAVRLGVTPQEYEDLFRMAWTAWAQAAREVLAGKN